MFTSSAIRKLSRSEEMFAETHNFVGLCAHMRGPLDVDAMSAAFDALLEAHPVFGGHLARDADGRHRFVVDDLVHPGIEVVELTDPAAEPPPIRLDQEELLIQLRLVLAGDESRPTLYVHHALGDGHHQFSLIEEMFSYYTDLVTTGKIRRITVEPAPDALETVLSARGIEKQRRSGLERFMPAVFAYDLPPSRRGTTDVRSATPLRVPVAKCQLTEAQTGALIAFSRAQKLGLNGLLSAVLLLAEWQVRGKTNIPVPYIYPVDLRYVLTPPVSATGCTNPVGVATYLAEINGDTTVVDLAADIAETFRADLADGVVQQSLLHFSPQYVGNPPGMPDVVMLTDNGMVPPIRTPQDVELTAAHGELYFAVDAGIDMYVSMIFADRLVVEHHSHAPGADASIAVIHSLLRGIAEQRGAGGVS